MKFSNPKSYIPNSSQRRVILLMCLVVSAGVLFIALRAEKSSRMAEVRLSQSGEEGFQISQTDWSGGPSKTNEPVAEPGNQFADSQNIDYRSQTGSIFLILKK